MNQPILAGISVAALLVAGFVITAPSAFADNSPYVLGTLTFTIAIPPRLLLICSGLCMEVTYMNNLNFNDTGIVYTVIQNSIGQTVSYQTATITPLGGQIATAFFVVSNGLYAGIYNASVFVVTPSGVAISKTSTIVFTTH